MNIFRNALFVTLAFAAASCSSTKQFASLDFIPPEGDYKIIVMRPDVSVGLVTMGGAVSPRAEWTEQARENLLRALVMQQADRGGNAIVATTLDEADDNINRIAELNRLHQVVGSSINTHKYLGLKLPTKENRFDWTLGSEAIAYGLDSGFDYALFIRAEDSFTSGGRAALQVMGIASCVVGVCVGVSGGTHVAFASLVDLDTGNIVWYNVLSSSVGDIRKQEGADKIINHLLEKMEAGEGEREQIEAKSET